MFAIVMFAPVIFHLWLTGIAGVSLFINIPLRSILSVSFITIAAVSAAIVIAVLRYGFGYVNPVGEYSNVLVPFHGFIGWHLPVLALGMYCQLLLKEYRKISGAISFGFIIASIWWFFYIWSFIRWH